MIRRAPVFRWMFDPSTTDRIAVRVGELSRHSGRWEFVFDAAYLSLGAQARELDPTGIRTKQKSAFTRIGVAPPPVFCDVALSGWSLDAMRRQAAEYIDRADEEPWGWWERLIYAPADGFGALFVGDLADKPLVEPVLQRALDELGHRPLATISLESSEGALGGERPKLAGYFRSETISGAEPSTPRPVIWKFALPSERSDSVVAEATALTLAHGLGMRVPRHHVQWIDGAAALCIDRFDRGPGIAGPVMHCVSAATALDLVPGTDVEDPRRSYVLLRSRLKRPGDADELFRRIVLNAVVGNTDDHPWNTSLRQVGLGDWELAPLYDVMPFFHRKGRPAFRMAITRSKSKAATLANLIACGREIANLDPEQAARIVDDTNIFVHERWRSVFEAHAAGGPSADMDDWAPVFEMDWST